MHPSEDIMFSSPTTKYHKGVLAYTERGDRIFNGKDNKSEVSRFKKPGI